MGQPQSLFRLFSVFSNKHCYTFYNKYTWFEPTTFSSNVYFDRAVIVHKKRPGNDHEKKKTHLNVLIS